MKMQALLLPALLSAGATLGLAVFSQHSANPIAEAQASARQTIRISATDVERAIKVGDRSEAQRLLNELRQTAPGSKQLANLQMALDIAVP